MYAQDTSVPTERSKAEIERILTRAGASAFDLGWTTDRAHIGFRLKDKFFRIEIPMPPRPAFKDELWRPNAAGAFRRVSRKQQEAEYEQSVRSRWRVAALVIKAKLEAVEVGISTVEREFLASLLLADNTSVGDWAMPQIEACYSTGKMPLLTAGDGPARE